MEIKNLLLFFSMVITISAKSCVHEWRSYHGTLEPYYYGISGGNFKTGVPAFIGRGSYDDLKVMGRIQTSEPTGLYHISGRRLHHITGGIEYLVKHPNYNYEWVPSAHGEYVEDAISPGYTPGREVHFVGRINIGNRTFVGKMIPNNGLNYEDANGNEITAQNYEILVCTVTEQTCCHVCDVKEKH